MNLLELLDRPIAFHRCFVTLTGSVTAAVLLSQAVYWNGRTNDPDGWFWKTQPEWEEETGLSVREQESARRCLVSLGVLQEERRGIPCKLWYRIDETTLENLLNKLRGKRVTGYAENAELDTRNQRNRQRGKRGTIETETTAEITTETTTDKPLPLKEGDTQASGKSPFEDIPTPSKKSRTRRPATLTGRQETVFNFWYARYPNKVNRQKAVDAWAKLNPDDATVRAIAEGLKVWAASAQWHGGAVQHPATWLNGRAWQDEPLPYKEKTTAAQDRAAAGKEQIDGIAQIGREIIAGVRDKDGKLKDSGYYNDDNSKIIDGNGNGADKLLIAGTAGSHNGATSADIHGTETAESENQFGFGDFSPL